MIIYILDKNKIEKYKLPQKLDELFVINYYLEGSTEKVLINIEQVNNDLIVKSNGSVNIIENNIWSNKKLEEYTIITAQIAETKENIFLYYKPILETNFLTVPLSKEKISIGSNNDCDIIYKKNNTLDVHAEIVKNNNNYYIQSSNQTFIYLNKKRVIGEKLKLGDSIFVNGLMITFMGSFLRINNPRNEVILKDKIIKYDVPTKDNTRYVQLSEEDSNLKLYDDNEYFFHTPYLKNVLNVEEIQIDSPPASQATEEVPLLLSLGSSLTMVAFSLVSGYNVVSSLIDKSKTLMELIPQILTCLSMIVGSLIVPRLLKNYQKKKKKQREQLRQTKFTEYLNGKAEEIKLILINQEQTMKLNYLSTKECYLKIINKNKNLWQREIADSDFLTVRLGIGTVDAKLKITAPEKHFTLDDDNLREQVYKLVENSKKINNVPITFSLVDKNISAIINSRGIDYIFLKSLIIQLVSYHSSGDLKLVFFVQDSKEEYWQFVKYLPHVWNDEKSVRFFASNIDDMKILSSYLEEEYKNRIAKKETSQEENGQMFDKNNKYKNFSQYYLIISDNCKLIKDLPIISNILNRSDNIGFSILFADSTLKNLPNECSSFIVIDNNQGQIIEKNVEEQKQTKFNVEENIDYDMEPVSQVLSNIPILSSDGKSELPTSISFLEMYNVGRIEHLNILNRWENNNPVISLKAPVGVHANKDLFDLDLHEKYHGPHGLIAGSTGSGKSEFIITFILSLAINYHPYEVQFVLIDYKGGGLAGAFENRETGVRIPHLIGTITNLDTSEMNRTLVSIQSELKRRQEKFNKVRDMLGESTIDIYKYQKLYREGTIKEPIAHLFIISDEFAELKKQQPEFMSELISIARIGRSLGVHLILATQKPSGVVNDQIWSNSKFKVCLKVQDRSDSMEVLKRPDAASIKEVGRFILQVGYDEYFDIGQSGWAGARYNPTDVVVKKIDDSISFINNIGYVTTSINTEIKENKSNATGDQLTNITKYIISLSEKNNIKTSKLWLDSIPEIILLNDIIRKYNYQSKPFLINPIIGEYDVPSSQYQGPLMLDLTNEGNTLIYGRTGSGKENLISTIVYSSCLTHGPNEINYYICDFGTESLKMLRRLPQVGDILLIDDSEKIIKLFNKVSSEIERRKELFSDYSGSYNEYIKNSGKTEPLITIVINNYEAFTESYGNVAELIYPFIRDGNKYGIVFIISSTSINAVRSRVVQNFNNKITLRLPNDADYRSVLNSPRGLYPADKFGRGLVAMNKTAYEFQTALISEKENINNTIKEVGNKMLEYYKQERAPKIPVLPNIVTTDMIFNETEGLTGLPLGVEKESLETYIWDFLLNPVTLISSVDIERHIYFANALLKELVMTKNVKIKIIDAIEYFKSIYSGVFYYLDNFDEVLKQIYEELQAENNNEHNTIYIITGIGKLKEKLNEDGKIYYIKIFDSLNKYQKSRFIFIDNYDNYRNIQIEEWYRTHVDNTFGIWLGEDVSTQSIINIKNIDLNDKRLNFPYMAFAVYKGRYMILKYVTEGVNIDEK